jgi:pimeloyl-ACP methyl ester carboxylesterase
VVEVRVVEVRGSRMSFRETGDAGGPAVVLLHGGGSDASTWDRFAGVLAAAGRRVIAPDLPGHGGTARFRTYSLAGYRDAVTGLLDALGLDRPALVGHSLGAYTASLIAQERPDGVGRLVLEDPPAPARDGAASAVLSPARVTMLFAGAMLRRRRYHPPALTSAIRELRRPDPGWWDRLPAITAPTLVLSGGPTSHLPPDRLADAAARIPGAEFVTIPVGHRIHSLAPDRFAAVVAPFLLLSDC